MADLSAKNNGEVSKRRPTLSVVAICQNEEADLPGFFGNLLPWVDEIIIVDDGSTDGTMDIIQQSGPKVKVVEQVKNPSSGFAGLRNRGIEEATSDWLLHMDIDERVPSALAHEIRSKIKTSTQNAYRYRRLNFFLHRPMRGGGFQDWNNPQLARRGKHHFEKSVHEICVVEGGPGSIGQLEEKMWHLNDATYHERMRKSMTYCQEQTRRLSARGVSIRWYHLLLLPFAEFLRKYIKRVGYRDGIVGLLWALHTADAMFRACALLWDEQNRLSRGEIEEKIRPTTRED